MPSITTTILSSLFAASALADGLQIRDTDNCPGVNFVRNSVSGCCVGGTVDSPYLSVCQGWPICQGPTTTTWTATPITCAAIVTDGPNYDSEIASARSSLKASGTHLVTPLDGSVTGGAASTPTTKAAPGSSGSSGSATATGTVSSGSGTGTAETGSTGASSTETSSAAAASTSDGAAAGLVAGWGVTGGAVVALVAALL